MKKHVASKLRQLANYIPPVVEFIPIRVQKTGEELNSIIDEEKRNQEAKVEAKRQAEFDALPWYDKIKVVAKEHYQDLGLIEADATNTIEPKITFEPEKVYVQKRKTPKLVNHYKNLKREWELNGQQGITDYAKRMKQLNELQNRSNATNPPGQETPTR